MDTAECRRDPNRSRLSWLVAGCFILGVYYGSNQSTTTTTTTTLSSAPNEKIRGSNIIKLHPQEDNSPPPISTHQHNSCDGTYIRRRGDRIGSVLFDMLVAAQFSHNNNMTFCGACRSGHRPNEHYLPFIEMIGLEDVLRLDCPSGGEGADEVLVHSKNFERRHGQEEIWEVRDDEVVRTMMYGGVHTFMPNKKHAERYGKSFSKEFMDWMKESSVQGRLKHRNSKQEGDSSANAEHKVVVHIRRGDVTPDGRYKMRYLPNSYYLEQIALHKRADSEVIIYGQSTTPDSYAEFRDAGYEVRLDGDPVEPWTHFIDCDVLILSSSSYAYVPALFSRAEVVVQAVFPMLPPLEDWVVVDYSWEAEQEKALVKEERLGS